MASLGTTAKTPRKKPLQARAQATVEALLEASAHILASAGYEALTTNHVAERAGVSIGSLYQYFPSKEAIIGELVDRHCDEMNRLFAEVFLASSHLSAPQLARAMVSAFYRSKCRNPALSRALREQLPRVKRLNRLEASLDQMTEVIAAYLTTQRPLLRVETPKQAAFYAVHLVEALCMASLRDPSALASPEAAVNEITDIVMRYLFP